MGENSAIEWTDHTFNPWVGCVKVSEACKHCYAESWANRWRPADKLWGPEGDRPRTSAANWRKPERWDAAARAAGTRPRVFCASLSDVFEDFNVKAALAESMETMRSDLWRLIRTTPNLDWLLLTKRAENIARMLPADWGDGYPNVWLGITVENQQRAEERIPHLLSVPAVARFLSMEPLLGPVQIDHYLADESGDVTQQWGESLQMVHQRAIAARGIQWVISGGESGPEARPMHPEWVRSLRDQCVAAEVPFLFKQWGEWAPVNPHTAEGTEGPYFCYIDATGHVHHDSTRSGVAIYRPGKKAAGRLLDGVDHRQFPVVR